MTDRTENRSGAIPTSCALVGGCVLTGIAVTAATAGWPNPLAWEGDEAGTALRGLPHGVAHVLMAVAGIATLLAVLAVRRVPRHRPRIVTVTCLVAIVALLLLVDHTVLTALGYLPIMLVGAITGSCPNFAPMWSLPLLLQGVASVAGTSVLLLALRRRRAHNRPGDPHEVYADAAARTRRWTLVAIEAPVLYALSRVLMACEVPGFTAPEFTVQVRITGLMLAAAAVGGAVLTWGLIRPWGERFPRWMVGLAGRRVPVNLAVVPAITVAAAVMAASRAMVPPMFFGPAETVWNSPLIMLPHLLWPLWSVALTLAALHYARRRSTALPLTEPVTAHR